MFSDTKHVEVLQNNQAENDDADEENFANATAVIPPKNKKVLHALDIIRQRLQFERENVDTFLWLERKMQDSMQNKIKERTIAQYFA